MMPSTNAPVNDAEKAWAKCLSIVKDNLNEESFKTWFEPIKPLKLEDGVLTVELPSQFYYEWLEEHYVVLLRKTIRHVLGEEGKLQYSVLMDNSADAGTNGPHAVRMPAVAQEYPAQNHPVQMPLKQGQHGPNPYVIPGLRKVQIDSQLNPYYTFDSFIEGEHNRLARLAGVAVANQPGETAFNPLYLHGGVGLGKTHLVNAIGNEIKRLHPQKLVLYLSSEKFTNQYVDSIRKNSTGDLNSFYQLIDVLIIDDIQFFAGKTHTLEFLFHVFNHLHQSSKQIIFTSDVPASELKGIEERVISRFKWGLSAGLASPDFEARIKILKRKIYLEGVQIPEDIIEYIAYNITSNIRELEGAIISLLAQSSFNRRQIDMDLARQIVKNFANNPNRELSIDSIQSIVSDYFNLPVERLKESTRKREVVQARHISMYFARKFTKASLKTIGMHFGGRDHSTVINALNTVQDLMATDRDFKRCVEEINKKISLTSH